MVKEDDSFFSNIAEPHITAELFMSTLFLQSTLNPRSWKIGNIAWSKSYHENDQSFTSFIGIAMVVSVSQEVFFK